MLPCFLLCGSKSIQNLCMHTRSTCTPTETQLTHALYYTCKILMWSSNLLQALHLIYMDSSYHFTEVHKVGLQKLQSSSVVTGERQAHSEALLLRYLPFFIDVEQVQSRTTPNVKQMTEIDCKESLLTQAKGHVFCCHLYIPGQKISFGLESKIPHIDNHVKTYTERN